MNGLRSFVLKTRWKCRLRKVDGIRVAPGERRVVRWRPKSARRHRQLMMRGRSVRVHQIDFATVVTPLHNSTALSPLQGDGGYMGGLRSGVSRLRRQTPANALATLPGCITDDRHSRGPISCPRIPDAASSRVVARGRP